MVRKHAEKFLLLFTAAGFLVSLYSLAQHYGPVGGACNVNQTFNCDIVNKGSYSEIAGFPVAGVGVVGYIVIGIVALAWRKEKDPVLAKALLALSLGGLAFSLYLTSIEAFVLRAWCLLCLASLSSIVGVAASSAMLAKKTLAKKTVDG